MIKAIDIQVLEECGTIAKAMQDHALICVFPDCRYCKKIELFCESIRDAKVALNAEIEAFVNFMKENFNRV